VNDFLVPFSSFFRLIVHYLIASHKLYLFCFFNETIINLNISVDKRLINVMHTRAVDLQMKLMLFYVLLRMPNLLRLRLVANALTTRNFPCFVCCFVKFCNFSLSLYINRLRRVLVGVDVLFCI
jgi:hypothetical protein